MHWILVFWIHTGLVNPTTGSSVAGAAVAVVSPMRYGSVEQCLAAASDQALKAAYKAEYGEPVLAAACSIGD